MTAQNALALLFYSNKYKLHSFKNYIRHTHNTQQYLHTGQNTYKTLNVLPNVNKPQTTFSYGVNNTKSQNTLNKSLKLRRKYASPLAGGVELPQHSPPVETVTLNVQIYTLSYNIPIRKCYMTPVFISLPPVSITLRLASPTSMSWSSLPQYARVHPHRGTPWLLSPVASVP